GETARASELAEEVRRRDPQNAQVQNELAKVFETLGDAQKAHQAYARAIKLDPQSEDYYLDLVAFLLSQEEPREAAALLRKALQKIQNSYSLTVALGTADQASGNRRQAMRIFSQAIKMRPDLAPAFVLY